MPIGSDPSPSMRHHYSVPTESALAGRISTACCCCCQLPVVGLFVSSFSFSARKVRAAQINKKCKGDSATRTQLISLLSRASESKQAINITTTQERGTSTATCTMVCRCRPCHNEREIRVPPSSLRCDCDCWWAMGAPWSTTGTTYVGQLLDLRS